MMLRDSLTFFINDTATTEPYTLSLHDALPICRHAPGGAAHLRDRDVPARRGDHEGRARRRGPRPGDRRERLPGGGGGRSEEHTSELQSRENLVCRLLLEKKKK